MLRQVNAAHVSGIRPRRPRHAHAVQSGAGIGRLRSDYTTIFSWPYRRRSNSISGDACDARPRPRARRLSARSTHATSSSLTLAGATAQTYFSIRSFDAQIIATRETLRTREESLALVNRRARGGVAVGSRGRAGRGIARASGCAAEGAAARAHRGAASAWNAHRAARCRRSPEADLAGIPVPPVPPPGLPSSLIERRPDIRRRGAESRVGQCADRRREGATASRPLRSPATSASKAPCCRNCSQQLQHLVGRASTS